MNNKKEVFLNNIIFNIIKRIYTEKKNFSITISNKNDWNKTLPSQFKNYNFIDIKFSHKELKLFNINNKNQNFYVEVFFNSEKFIKTIHPNEIYRIMNFKGTKDFFNRGWNIIEDFNINLEEKNLKNENCENLITKIEENIEKLNEKFQLNEKEILKSIKIFSNNI